MIRVDLLRNRLFAVLFGCFAVSLGTAYLSLRDADGAMRSRLAENAVWAGAQIQNELSRFRDELHRFTADPQAATAAGAQRRFDLLWSRVSILEAGELTDFVLEAGLTDTVAAIREDLNRLDPLIAELAADSPTELPRSILTSSAEMLTRAQTLSAAIMLAERDRVAKVIDQRDEALNTVSVSLIGMLIFGVATLVSLSLSLRRARTARSRAELSRQTAVAANDRLTTALNSMSDGFAIIGPDNRFTILNSQFQQLFGERAAGLAPGDEFRGFADALGTAFPDGILASIEDGNTERFMVALPEGRHVECRIRPMSGGGRVFVAADVTDREVWLEQTEAARKAAEHSNAAKSRFLAMMSHEIRTPMNGVLGLLEALQDDPLPPASRRQLDLAMRSAGTLRIVIDDLLDASKIEAGELRLAQRSLDPGNLTAEVCDLLRANAREVGTVLIDRVSPDVPSAVSGDPDRIRQILSNLVGNAIKFTPAGTIDVSLRVCDAGGRSTLRFEVRDTGIGIPASKHADLFRHFQQIDSGYVRKFGGTGLGLAIAKALTEAMGGTIGFSSEEGRGSTFWFSIPLIRSVEAPPPIQRAAAATIRPSKPPRVLLVEDSETNRIVARAFLRTLNADVDEAENGAVGVELARRNDYDIVLMDVAMPVLDGIDATRRIRQFSDVPIVGLSAHAFEEEIGRCLDAGMDDYLAKPVTKAILVDKVATTVAGSADGGAWRQVC